MADSRGFRRNLPPLAIAGSLLALAGLPLALPPEMVQAKDKTIVHHYYHGTQNQRKSTRFTILEWLKIKKRIKEMDVWLAMYSSPKKAKFRPELKLCYSLNRANHSIDHEGLVASQPHQHMNRRIKGQLFLTNLMTSTLRAKLLNIDIGFEMNVDHSHSSKGTARLFPRTTLAPGFATDALYSYSALRQAINVRLLGSHSQDSAMMVKYGKLQEQVGGSGLEERQIEGYYTEIESLIYLTSWFAIHGSWQQDQAQKDSTASLKPTFVHRNRRELGATIDIGLFGVTAGVFDYSRQRDMGLSSGGAGASDSATVPIKGQFIGLNVNF